MKCAECMWAIWDYAGMECVDCKAGLDDKCPTDADVEHAKAGGYLAFYGCSERTENGEENESL